MASLVVYTSSSSSRIPARGPKCHYVYIQSDDYMHNQVVNNIMMHLYATWSWWRVRSTLDCQWELRKYYGLFEFQVMKMYDCASDLKIWEDFMIQVWICVCPGPDDDVHWHSGIRVRVTGIITMDLRVLPRLLVTVTYTQRLADLESSALGRVAAGLTGSHGTVTGGPGCLVPSAWPIMIRRSGMELQSQAGSDCPAAESAAGVTSTATRGPRHLI